MDKIDFVALWVDSDDPNWLAKKNKYLSDEQKKQILSYHAISEERFRQTNNFRYWFRAVEENAPWFNKIYLVTDEQKPEWLNINHPKLVLVDHKDYIPEQYLPLFNSAAIEVNIHRIKDLSEHFVYINDDFLINTKVTPEDFFKNGKPCQYVRLGNFYPYRYDVFDYTIFNDMIAINRNFTPEQLQNLIKRKLLNPAYGYKTVFRNLVQLPFKNIGNFAINHYATPYLKSVFNEVWEKEFFLLDRTSKSKFRLPYDLNIFVFRYWYIAQGNFVPSPCIGKYYGLANCNLQEMEHDIRMGDHKLICVNDEPMTQQRFLEVKETLSRALEARYPRKSSFEL